MTGPIPLYKLKVGQSARIVSTANTPVQNRLTVMGLRTGDEVELISRLGAIGIRSRLVSLGIEDGIAKKILVDNVKTVQKESFLKICKNLLIKAFKKIQH